MPPPGKTAVSYDVMLALAHQTQIFIVFVCPIVVNIGSGVGQAEAISNLL
jgi:hypothetical protein